eukprot:Gb_25789 [translate_table: standard]
MAFPALLNLSKNSIERFVRSPTRTKRESPRMSPKIFMVAGSAMIPAPIIVVDRFNTAPENVAFLYSEFSASCPFLGSRGILSFFSSNACTFTEVILKIYDSTETRALFTCRAVLSHPIFSKTWCVHTTPMILLSKKKIFCS